MYTALRACTLTLVDFIKGRFLADPLLGPFFGGGGTMDVRLNTPDEMQENQMEGLSVWLYRIVRDEQRVNAPPIRVSSTLLRPPPLPLCLHYLMTPITSAGSSAGPEREQLILGKMLQILNTTPILRGADLSSDFVGTSVELHVRLETMTLEEITRVWEGLEGSYQLSVSYEVGVVEIESELAPQAISPVVVPLPQDGVIVSES